MAGDMFEGLMAPSPPQDERLVAVDHLIATEREHEDAKRRADEAVKRRVVAGEAHAAALAHVRSLLGYDNDEPAKSPGY